MDELLRVFPVSSREPSGAADDMPAPLAAAFAAVGGATLAEGFYRFHTPQSALAANQACAGLIRGFAGRFHAFAFDWLGRELAVDLRDAGGDGQVICVDPGGGEYLTTDCRFSEWHDVVAGAEDPLAYSFYLDWRRANPGQGPLTFGQAVGYRVPLFLGGVDEVANLEVSDREVYFEICTQLAVQTRVS